MRIAAATDVGQVRALNEDNLEQGLLPGGSAFAVVCDGMGGAAGGDLASKLASESIANALRMNYMPGLPAGFQQRLLVTALENANTKIYHTAAMDSALEGMGTTAVAVIAEREVLHVAHVGDSRAYLLHGGALHRLTKDHSVVQALIDQGELTEEEAMMHPRRNLITRALGVGGEIEADYGAFAWEPGDFVLLCTDGLTNCASEEAMVRVLTDRDFADTAKALVFLANQGGGQDNITAAVIANAS
ncbi:MAG: Stp1/IreP family PP2C-type Ser/Thr phosphatase [Oscillospiraceae bacterium]|jgi:protein phosphatase|nr:Stp1/IreP family PP2C-type Ser/Thr phosphatase [Oscillospiraceae bacterium]